ncbi:GntR family transcriptional regulator [Nocardia sp. XZ_19_385]|uniref:GntR family transcriptional regulator n=1 Tax=Nocardia sp. XZ_19_385 TaxID=2769488 RepID=UPI00188FA294|nr:GntR family transcriptional regulator [Nocardia sp. XZ_19_385]
MGTQGVSPARRRGLADEVADNIREAIFTGVYAPGEQIREVELSAALKVSRGPVREALLRLEREGMTRSEWHRGATVVTLTAADVAELSSLRGALDRLAVEQVVAHASDEDIAQIERSAAAMDRVTDEHEMVRCDMAFHDAVYAAAGHQRLQDAWHAIRSQVHLLLLTRIGVSTEGYLPHVAEEHRQLAAALRSRNAEEAIHLFAVHRGHAVDIVTTPEDPTYPSEHPAPGKRA